MSNAQNIIRNAIDNKKCLSFTYDGLYRVVEPHAFGIHRDTGNLVLRAYQVGGRSHSNEQPCWHMFILNKILDLKMIDQIAEFPRPGYKKGDKHMSKIYSEL